MIKKITFFKNNTENEFTQKSFVEKFLQVLKLKCMKEIIN